MNDLNANMTKKEHVVPQCYLEAWTRTGSKQVFVFDKLRKMYRQNSIEDVACQRHFYDTHPVFLLKHEELKKLTQEGKTIDPDADQQVIEHIYADQVETLYKDYLEKLISIARSATPWAIKNCYFINFEEKEELSQLITIQYIRTKSVRNRLEESGKCLSKVLRDMGIPDGQIKKYQMTKEQVKNTHLQMMTDLEKLESIASSFYNLTWMLCVNRSPVKFYTSDNPIFPIPHYTPDLAPASSGAGLRCKGVEVFFPLAPDCALTMFDGEYHQASEYDRRFAVSDICEIVDYYNSMIAVHAEETVFSQDGNWEVINEMLVNEPKIFTEPKTTMIWGDKVYTPE